ncbi:MAG: MBL fold metallo-hydrolase [Oscillospiraceae bacterium]|nr:MBL fold metallo-hydrolase [Oscillospiraceae bacterium]
MIVAPLCSSSSANSTFVGTAQSGVLIDVGCSYKALRGYLNLSGIELSAIKAVLITHEHGDHINGLRVFAKNKEHINLPIYAPYETHSEILHKGLDNPDRLFGLDKLSETPVDFAVAAFPTPHDSAGSAGYVITDSSGYKIAYMTDLGEVTPQVEGATLGANFVFIEANYESDLLQKSSYPQATKDRIRSRRGHLSNADSAEYIVKLVESGATRIVLGHLSRENNTPQTAWDRAANRLATAGLRHDYDFTLDVARVQTAGSCMAV